MAWNEDRTELLTEDPGYYEVSSMKLPRPADVYCPSCGKPCRFPVEWGEDHPPEDEETVANCWSCGVKFRVSWSLVPEWTEHGRVKEEETA